jgi:hypothetical protein
MDHPTAALLVVVVADDTLAKGTTTTAGRYATAGTAEYWGLDLDGRRLIAVGDAQPIPDGGAASRSRTVPGPADGVAPLAAPGAAVRVADLLP